MECPCDYNVVVVKHKEKQNVSVLKSSWATQCLWHMRMTRPDTLGYKDIHQLVHLALSGPIIYQVDEFSREQVAYAVNKNLLREFGLVMGGPKPGLSFSF